MSSEAMQLENTLTQDHLQVCRLCLSEELLEDIFKYDDLNLWISGFLSIVISEDDKISRSICALCQARLNEFRDYQLRCFEVQDVLQSETSTHVAKDPSLSETKEPEPSSEAHPEFTISDKEEKADDDDKRPIHLYQRIVVNKSGTKRYCYGEKDAYKNQKIECSTCGENVHKSRMEGHQNRHKGVRPYKCELGCKDMDFYSRENQLIHQRETHSVERYECDSCNKVFRAKRNLCKHKVNVHSKIKCSTCGEQVHKSLMKDHQNSHKVNVRSSKSFLCSICNLRLTTRVGFNGHMQRMHDPNRKLQFPCPHCNRSYGKNGFLQKHLMQCLMQIHLVEKSKKGLKMSSVEHYDSLEAPKVKNEPDVDAMKIKDKLQDDSYAEVEGHVALFEAEEAKIEPDSNPE